MLDEETAGGVTAKAPVAAGPPTAPPVGGTPNATAAPTPMTPDQMVGQIPGLDPKAQAELAENMRRTPPEYWPQILQTFKTAAAMKNAPAKQRGPQPAGPPAPGDMAEAARAVAEASGLPEHPYDSRQAQRQPPSAMPVTPGNPSAAQSLAQAFAPRDPRTALTELNDPIDAPASAVQQVTYQEPLPVASDPKQAIDAAIRELEQQSEQSAAGSTDAARKQVELRLLLLAAGRRDDALKPISGLTTAEQEYWSSQFYALSTWLDNQQLPAADRRANEALTHLDRARGKLAEMGTLQVRNPHFCTRVDGFGSFTKFKEDVFRPAQDVVLYTELENFRSDSSEDGYRTALTSRYRILDSQGRQVVEHDFPAIEEVCQNRRRDYYVSFRVQMPSRIYDGRHTLQLTVEDTLGKKVGQTSIEFAIKE